MKKLLLAAALIASPTYAQVQQPTDEYKRIEYKVRLEYGSEKTSEFILQDKSNDSEVRCGWVWSKKPYPNNGWKMFSYSRTSKDELVLIYDETLSDQTINYLIISMCYDKGYIPSLIPLGKYFAQWNLMTQLGRSDNFGF